MVAFADWFTRVMKLFLVESRVDMCFLRSWGVRHGHLKVKNDFGYVIHAVLKILFRENHPQNFSFDQSKKKLYFYTKSDENQLALDLASKNRDVCSGLGLVNFGDGCVVTDVELLIPLDGNLNFHVLTFPTKRLTDSGREVDAFNSLDGGEQERSEAYKNWLLARFDASWSANVRIESVAIEQHSVLRRQQREVSRKERHEVVIHVPLVKFAGTFKAHTNQYFLDALLKGIGRHKAFGAGMLLIQHPSVLHSDLQSRLRL